MQKNLIVRQDGYKECGSAALLSIIRYYNGDISINRLVEMTNTTKEGTSFYYLKKAASELGLEAKGYKVDDIQKLMALKVPFICQFQSNNYSHFVVVYKITSNKVIIMDPASGKLTLDILDFSLKWTGNILVFSKKDKLPVYISDKYLNKILAKVLLDNKNTIFEVLLLSLFFTGFTCITTFYFQIILDKVINTAYKNLVIVTLIFLFFYLIKNISSYYRHELIIYLNEKIDLSLIINTLAKVILLPFHYYKNRTTGEIISRINDLAYIKNMLSEFIITVSLDLIITLVSGIILFYINKEMFFILLIMSLIYLMLVIILNPYLNKSIKINQENNAKINSYLVETISSFETIKALHLETAMRQKFEKLYTEASLESLEYQHLINLENFFKDLISTFGLILIYFIGSTKIMNSELSIGNMLTFNFLINYYLNPIQNIISNNSSYHYAKNAITRANNLLEIEEEKFTESKRLSLTGDINIKNLSFSYNPNNIILKGINLTINTQEKVLILGNSGSGKSSLFKLLYGYYKPERGQIYINNYDILDYDLEDIRNDISYISQHEMLYTDTILNNIILDREVDKESYLNICKLTYVEDIVKSRFLGYDTLLEENGVNLSGGQRQRIVLARALLKKSKILLIDEGLNEVDINLERKILKNIFSVFNDKTIIIISHRLDNMDLYDKVVKMEEGMIKAIITKNKVCYG